MNWGRTYELIKSDIIRRTVSDGKKLTFFNVLTSIFSPSVVALILFRFQHYFHHKNLYPLSKLLGIMNIIFFAVEIGSKCQIGEGFILGHANGILIHDQVIIGKNCTVMHQTSIGIKYLEGIPVNEQFTILEDDILVGSGARFMGPCIIGKGSRIAMNSLVTDSFPEKSVIAGVPGKLIRLLEDSENFTAETMKRNFNDRPNLNISTLLKLINEDLKHRAHIDGKKFSSFNYIKLFLNPPAMAVFLFRWASFFDRASFPYIAKLITTINIIVLKTDIGSKAEIEGGLVVGHANGVLINNQVKIGKNAVFMHHNTVAIGPRKKLSPETDRVVIGDNFFCGAGARVLGNIEIGDNCTVAMNAVVTKSVPPNSVLTGIPATILKSNSGFKAITRKSNPLTHPDKKQNFSSTISTIKQDIGRRAELENKKGNLFYFAKVIANPAAMAVVIFRFASYFEKNGYHLPAKLLANINNILYTVEIQPGATIGPGLILAHANGIMIHTKSIIGKNCCLTLQNTITVGPKANIDPINDRTILGDNIFIGMGARIVGNITIGNDVSIGANAVVTKSAPEGAILVGVPAIITNKENLNRN